MAVREAHAVSKLFHRLLSNRHNKRGTHLLDELVVEGLLQEVVLLHVLDHARLLVERRCRDEQGLEVDTLLITVVEEKCDGRREIGGRGRKQTTHKCGRTLTFTLIPPITQPPTYYTLP